MNYEVNSFQNYESITIDELKDQANSLLNPVTEEQRKTMKKGLEEALEAGCVGISYGLRYVPGTGREDLR